MAERRNFSVGAVVTEVPDGTVVTRPDGSTNTVTGGEYVLDVPGDFLVGDREVTAK